MDSSIKLLSTIICISFLLKVTLLSDVYKAELFDKSVVESCPCQDYDFGTAQSRPLFGMGIRSLFRRHGWFRYPSYYTYPILKGESSEITREINIPSSKKVFINKNKRNTNQKFIRKAF